MKIMISSIISFFNNMFNGSYGAVSDLKKVSIPDSSNKDFQEPSKQKEMNFRNNVTLILSAGHGAIDPNSGEYHCLAKGKKFKFPDDVTVYEGELNRLYSNEIKRQALELGYKVEEVHHKYLDYSLGERHRRAIAVKGECCLLPIHHNASLGHNAEGIEIFTSRGKTAADTLVDFIWMKLLMLKRFGYDVRMRSDMTDGDYDKESGFYEIRKFAEYHKATKYSGAHAYGEFEFFDYLPNRDRLIDMKYVRLVCRQYLQGIDLYYKQRLLS